MREKEEAVVMAVVEEGGEGEEDPYGVASAAAIRRLLRVGGGEAGIGETDPNRRLPRTARPAALPGSLALL